MRGFDARPDALFSYVSCEVRVPRDHPADPADYGSIVSQWAPSREMLGSVR